MSRFIVRSPEQLELLASPLRQQILAAAAELGDCSIAELAAYLGTPADMLYYHVRKLSKAGLLLSQGKRSAARRDEENFRAPGSDIRLEYGLTSERTIDAIQQATAALLRLAQRDFEQGTRDPRATTKGRARNLRSGRSTAWLSREQLHELDALLGQIDELFARTPPERGKQMHAFSFVLAPIAGTRR